MRTSSSDSENNYNTNDNDKGNDEENKIRSNKDLLKKKKIKK
jgi:hypothetical protein